MVEEHSVARKYIIGLPVVDHDPVGIQLGGTWGGGEERDVGTVDTNGTYQFVQYSAVSVSQGCLHIKTTVLAIMAVQWHKELGKWTPSGNSEDYLAPVLGRGTMPWW